MSDDRPTDASTPSGQTPAAPSLDGMSVEALTINTIRTLAMDAVQQADSGHPGTPMALAPLAYVLWSRFLRYNPENPRWFDRDRFVLSAGHASMLQYAMLFLAGYGLTLDDLRRFRQWGSPTPGHPEYGVTPGVETTTGPLGQGLMNSVGMAIAEAHLSALYNRPGHTVVNHNTYAVCSDGDFMEGASHEAASLAGHLGLGKLIWIYDDNHITIEGDTALAYSDDVARRFEAYHWHVQDLGEASEDLDALTLALANARKETARPSLVIVRSHIGYGAPTKQDTADAHGSPLGADEVRGAKRFYGWPEEPSFLVPHRALEHMRQLAARGPGEEAEWRRRLEAYRDAYPDLAARLEGAIDGGLPPGWDADVPVFAASQGPMATRKAAGTVLNAFAERVPFLMGGAGDLAGSTKTLIDGGGDFSARDHAGRNMHWGIREHVMCGASNGMALHGGVRPYASTFFIFTDYARPSIRLASLMELPVVYVMTHDSIGLGEDGPTHQAVEHLASFRAMPGMTVIRPADANETAMAWRSAMSRTGGPTMLVLSRQKLPILDRSGLAPAAGALRGAYVLAREGGNAPDAVLIASGSEVHIALEARGLLAAAGIDARVVSMPSWEIFREQDAAYRDEVLPPGVRTRVAVEAGASQGWLEWVTGDGAVVGVDRFGASAPWKEIYAHLGLTGEAVARRTRDLLGR